MVRPFIRREVSQADQFVATSSADNNRSVLICSLQLGREGALDLLAGHIMRPPQPARQLLRERLLDESGPPHGSDRLQQLSAALHEGTSPLFQWPCADIGGDQAREALELQVGDCGVEALEVLEVLEHRPQGDAGALRDLGGGGPQVSFLDQAQQGGGDGGARPLAAGVAAVDRRDDSSSCHAG